MCYPEETLDYQICFTAGVCVCVCMRAGCSQEQLRHHRRARATHDSGIPPGLTLLVVYFPLAGGIVFLVLASEAAPSPRLDPLARRAGIILGRGPSLALATLPGGCRAGALKR